MSGYSVSGIVPARFGGEWDNCNSWFLIDESGEFSVDKDITATIYLVGSGTSGGSSTISLQSSSPRKYGFFGGNGGRGGRVCTVSGVKIVSGEICTVSIGANTLLDISGSVYSSNGSGYVQHSGGRGAVGSGSGGSSGISIIQSVVNGTNGVLTPYGYVGSSGGGGSFYGSYADGGEGAYTNYGGGGHGSPIPVDSVVGTYYNYGQGQDGCVIICVENEELEFSVEIPYLQEDLVYNGKLQTPFDESLLKSITISGDINGISAGKYVSILSLDKGVKWADGTTAPITVEWEIKKASVPRPVIETTEYEYTGDGSYSNTNYKLPVISGFDQYIMTQSGDGLSRQYKAGTYSIVFSLNDTDSCSWLNDDGTASIDDYIVTWKISSKIAPIPKVTSSDFIYDGKSHSAVVDNVDLNIMAQSGNPSAAINAGNYYITYTLRDTDSCYWEDGTVGEKTVYWNINKQIVYLEKPNLGENQTKFTYDGKTHTPVITNRNNNMMTVSGTLSSIAAGNWKISIALKTAANYEYRWVDGTSDDIILRWQIQKGVFDVKLAFEEIYFDGLSHVNSVTGYNSNVMAQAGTLLATKAGEYTVTYGFKDKDSAVWADGTNEPKTLTWNILPITIAIPTVMEPVVIAADISYSGNTTVVGSRTLAVNGIDTNLMLLSGNSGRVPSKYMAVVSLKDKASSRWEDETIEDKTFEWEITKKITVLKKPYLSVAEFIYDGATKNVVLNDFLEKYHGVSAMQAVGTRSAAKADEYTVTVKLLDNAYQCFKWDDGSVDPVKLNWKIVPIKFAVPEISPAVFKYDGTIKEPVESGFDPDIMVRSSGGVLSSVEAGRYFITYSLKDVSSTSWSDGTVEDKIVEWRITTGNPVKIPKVENLDFVYDGNEKAPTVSEFDTNIIKQAGTLAAVNAGKYVIVFSLKDSDSAYWDDYSITDKIYEWEIKKKIVQYAKPILGVEELDYNGRTQYIPIINYENSAMLAAGHYSVEAGEYTAVVSLRTAANYLFQWTDGTSDNVELKWRINVITVKIPALSQTMFYYGGSSYNESDKKWRYSFRHPKISGYNPDIMYQSGASEGYRSGDGDFINTEGTWYGASQWRLGKYYVCFSFRHPESCIWENGTNGQIVYEWSIQKEIVLLPKPYLVNYTFEYDGTVKMPDVANGANKGLVFSGVNSAVVAEDYVIIASLKNTETVDYRWEDNTIGNIYLNWKITKTLISFPSMASTKFVYDGTPHLPVINEFDKNTMAVAGNSANTAAGKYEIIFSLSDPDSCAWIDGTTEDQRFGWVIEKSTVLRPTIAPDYMEYDGEIHTVEVIDNESDHSFIINGFDPNIMMLSGDTRKTNVGKYNAVVGLKDPDSCAWRYGSDTNTELPWEIRKKTVLLDKPYLDVDRFLYDGKIHTPKIERYKTSGMVIKSDSVTSAVASGEYSITVALQEDQNIAYLWGDAERNSHGGELTLNWKIAKAVGENAIKIPVVSSLHFVYDGILKAPVISAVNSDIISVSGALSAIDSGEYKILFSLKDKESCEWENGTVDDISVKWNIEKCRIDLADKLELKTSSFVYDGLEHTPDIRNFDPLLMTVSGDKSAVKAGKYTIIVEPNDNCRWSDGTNVSFPLDWEITKLEVELPLVSSLSHVYDGKAKAPLISVNEAVVTINGDKNGVRARKYLIVISLKDKDSSCWVEGSVEDITIKWEITKRSVEKPCVPTVDFVYNGLARSPDFDYDKDFVALDGEVSAIAAGEYKIVFSLNDKKSLCWSDDSTDDLSYRWQIDKAILKIPDVTNLEFVYDGVEHAPEISDFDTNVIVQSGTASAVNAGEYKIVFAIKDKNSADWAVRSAENIIVDWNINKATVEKPYIQNTEFTYNLGTHVPSIRGFNSEFMVEKDASIRSAIDAGIYHVYIGLRDERNYKWVDGDSELIDFEWRIHGRSVNKPYLDVDIFQYNGKLHTPNVLGFSAISMKKSGDVDGVNIGDYSIIIELLKNYEWSDGTTEDLVLPWSIAEVLVPVPNVSDTKFKYDGTIHSPKLGNYDGNIVSVSGTLNAVNSGIYTVIFSLNDKEYCRWENGSSENISVEWSIGKIMLKKPTAINLEFVYNGGYHLPVIHGVNEKYMVASGNPAQVNAGDYACIISLKDKVNYIWDDGTNDNIIFNWRITRKTVLSPYLDPNSFTFNGATKTPVIKNFNSKIMEIVSKSSSASASAVGTYKIVIRIGERVVENGTERYIRNYQWVDGTVNDLILEWKIVRGKLKYPTIVNGNLVYNWQTQSPVISGFISGVMAYVGTWRAKNAGVYQVGFKLKDTQSYSWENPDDEGKLFTWEIKRKAITKIPYTERELVYNGQKQTPVWLDYDIRQLTIGGINEAIDAGIYVAEFIPTNNFIWSDGTLDPLRLSWVIAKLAIGIPIQSNVIYYNGNEQKPTWRTVTAADTVFSGETSGILAGEYYVSCQCNENCFFAVTGTIYCDTLWYIQKCRLQAPSAEKKYYYTGEFIKPSFARYNPKLMTANGDLSGMKVGDYTAKFDIIDKKNYAWFENVYTDKNGFAVVSWKIVSSRRIANIPYQSNSPYYNGEPQSPVFANYNTSLMTLIGGIPSKIYAGIYYVVFRLKENVVWSDETTEDKVVPWRIYKKKYPCPYIYISSASGGMYYYAIEGKRYPIWRDYIPDNMGLSGDTFDDDDSWHITYITLKDPDNCEWSCGDFDSYSISWKLSEAYVPEIRPGSGNILIHIPRQVKIPYEDGAVKYPEWDNFDNTAIIKIGGVWEGIFSDTYYVILELRYGYVWEDGTAEIKAVPWEILAEGEPIPNEPELIPIHIPEQVNIPSYDGLVKEPEWDQWDKFGIDIVFGELYGVLAGAYYLTLRLQTGYIWEDGTLEDKIVIWVIEPRDIVEIPDDDIPKSPEPEKEGDENSDGTDDEKHSGGCCCCCCCDLKKDDQGGE